MTGFKLLIAGVLITACARNKSVTESGMDSALAKEEGETSPEGNGDSSNNDTSTGAEPINIDARRILFMMDHSPSMACSDPMQERWLHFGETFEALRNEEDTLFGYLGFSDGVVSVPFLDAEAFEARLERIKAEPEEGPASDFQGALTAAIDYLRADMEGQSADARLRTQYRMIFHSDGLPEPRCYAGCDDSGTVPDALFGLCNSDSPVPDDAYLDFHPCGEYNHQVNIFRKVDDLLALASDYSVGDMTIDTVLVVADRETVESACISDAESAPVDLLRDMAEYGGGEFLDLHAEDREDPEVVYLGLIMFECDSRYGECGTPNPPEVDTQDTGQ